MNKISVILPAYNEQDMIKKSFDKVQNTLLKLNINYEVIYINDGSKDNTWHEIYELTNVQPSVIGINFSRNFGKEAAIRAGLSAASGSCVVVMDCDMQHPPEKIREMYNLWMGGYEIVEGVKTNRGKERFFNKFSARVFYKTLEKITGFQLENTSDFKLLDRKVVDEFLKLSERKIFFRAMSFWLGFKSVRVEFEVEEREIGITKWSTTSLVKYAINNITSFSAAPLQIVTILGGINLLFSIILGVQSIFGYMKGDSLEGFTTVILLLLFIGSTLMISLGIIGYYLSKIYDEIKGRPAFIITEIIQKTNMKKNVKETIV